MDATSGFAVLFDVDGTLVDSNYLHVDAWQHAFRTLGENVPAWRIHRAIGLDSARLIAELVGARDDEWMARVKELHSEYYLKLSGSLRPFDRAADLLRRISERGALVVLATSAPDDELAVLRRTIDADDAIHDATSADDVEEAKPEPDIIEVALQRAGVDAAHAILIGDSVWDMEAAGRAGVAAFGLRSGGVSAAELLEAGARAVYDDPADVLEHLHELPGP